MRTSLPFALDPYPPMPIKRLPYGGQQGGYTAKVSPVHRARRMVLTNGSEFILRELIDIAVPRLHTRAKNDITKTVIRSSPE